MRKFSLSLLSLSLLLFTCLATRSEFERFNQCQLNNINALEPDHRVEHEAGLTETWNPNHPELQCAGVSLIRRTIDPNGLHLPSYSPSPQLIFIIQGKGVLGLSVPGCPETFEQPRSSRSRQLSRHQEQQQQPDSHQKIRRFYRGDVIAIPAGTPYWTYNHGDEPLVAISLLDTSNFVNQLDSTPRVFYLGGNPEVEFPETQEGQQGRHQQRPSFPGRKGGRHQQEEGSEEQNEGSSVLSGFSSEFLAQALNTDQDTAKRLQSPRDQRSQIVRVEGGLSIISPEWQQEDEEYERSPEEEEDEGRPIRIVRPGHSQEEREWDPRRPGHGQEQREWDPRRPGHGQEQREWDPRRPGHGQEQREWDPRRPGHGQEQREWDPKRPGHSQEQREQDPRRPGHSQEQREEDPRRPGHSQEEREWDPRRPGHSQEQREQDPRRPGHSQEQREEDPRRPGHSQEEREWDPRRPGHSQEQREQDPRRPGHSQDERIWYRRRPGHSQEEREWDPRRPGHSQEQRPRGRGEERVEECERRCEGRSSSKGVKNGLEETICSARIIENIARPARADLYNPRAGRISDANSLTLPILRNLRLSAEYVLLYRNGIYAPHWNINANSLMYVIRGQGRVRIVNCQGNAVFDDNVRRGQLLVVPQNFVVAQQAGNEEALEYVVFKTNDVAAVNHVKQVFTATPAEVLANAFGLRPRDVTQIKFSGNRGPLVHPQSQSQ